MGPVEGFYLSVAGTIVLIGLARGYKRELGNTLVFIGAVFIFAALYELAWDEMITVSGAILSNESVDIFLCAALSIIFVSIVFASYAGRTLNFHGEPAPPPGGFLISLAVASVNGYLVAGTLWFFQAIFNYPLSRIFDWFIPRVPECQEAALLANDLAASTVCVREFIASGQPLMWPPVLFPSAIFWAIPLAIMIILKVRG
jgi:hypothetical protein